LSESHRVNPVSEAELTVSPSSTLHTDLGARGGAPAAVGVAEVRVRGDAQSVDARRRGLLVAALVTMRPNQWIKNLLVIAAAGAAGALGQDDVPVRVGLAFVAFCLLASGIYAVNDVRDADEARLHPRKCCRPVAAGELSPKAACALGLVLVVVGVSLCLAIRPLLATVGAGYVALTLSYTIVRRYVLAFDIVAIAGGFVLCAVAGGVAAPVALSRWFVLVVTCAALFVATGKRRAELRRTVATNALAGRRIVLKGYTELRLRVILILSGVVAVVAYAVWASELPDAHGVSWRPLTIIPFSLGLLRYGVW